MRRFATCCGVQLCGGASIPRLVCVFWLFRVLMPVVCPCALASTKEIRVRARVTASPVACMLPVTGRALVGYAMYVLWSLTRVTALPVGCMLPVTGRALDGNVTHALGSHGPAVLLSSRVPGMGGVTGSVSSCRLVRLVAQSQCVGGRRFTFTGRQNADPAPRHGFGLPRSRS